MRVPQSLVPLVDDGIVQEVVRPLMSGKEADVYLVMSGGELRVAKIYKEAIRRSFKHRSSYTEGRRVRNSREQRAMGKKSRYGRERVEAAWRTAEVDAIYRLRANDVRVPEPFDFVDGVLVMELVTDAEGHPAPRLVDVELSRQEARDVFHTVLQEVVKMLCAGLVHGDLSDFNVLMGADGPVLIDFPQAVDATRNQSARKLLLRDVDNLIQFLSRFDTKLRGKKYGQEMWELYEHGELSPDTKLTGKFRKSQKRADPWGLLAELEAIERESRPGYVDEPEEEAKRTGSEADEAPKPKRSRRRRRRGGKKAKPSGESRPETKPAKPGRDPAADVFDDLDSLLTVEDS